MPSEKSQILSEYFRSIEHSFEETLASQRRTNWLEVIAIISLLLFIFSIFPFIPWLLTRVVPWAMKSNALVVKGHRMPLASLWIWWPTCSIFLFALVYLLFKWESSREKKYRKRWLSEPQLRFSCCFAIVEEIAKYETNGIQKHADAACEYWDRLRTMLPHMLRPFSSMYPHGLEEARFGPPSDSAGAKQQRFVVYPEIDALRSHFSWFRLGAQTDSIIEAFYGLPTKIQDRLRDKKDLDEVASCLGDLSGWLYSRIPEIPTRRGAESLADLGDKSLLSFTEKLSTLPPYTTEPKAATHHAQFWKNTVSIVESLTLPFAHPNIFACFLAWYFLTLVLTLGVLRAVLHFLPTMTIDSVLVSLIVGGPLACAVTAVAISRARKPDDSTSNEK